jgi:hypothetical protein
MRVLFAGQVPKDPLYPDAIEDSFVIRIADGRLALSDGASESYDSKTWARIVTSQFAEDPAVSASWPDNCIRIYADEFDVQALSWSKQASFNRGSYATLLGVEIFPEKWTMDVMAVGDTICAVIENKNIITTFPYIRHEEFQQRPELFSTLASNNSFVSDGSFYSKYSRTFSVPPNCKTSLLCMTDALGEWALRSHAEGEPQWSLLLSISATSELEELVMIERAAKRMRIDDVTLIHIDPFGDEVDELPIT